MPSALRAPLLVLAALAGGACAFPTDASTGTFVTVEAQAPVLLRGAQTALVARVWRRGSDGDSSEVRNARLVWSTSDPRIATVADGAAGVGRVTGVNPGLVELRAVAAGLESAEVGRYLLRVANPLEIDSITPDTVRYGERVTMHGVGVADLFFAGLGNGFLVVDSLSATGSRRGLGQIDFWVAFPARTGRIFAAGSGQLVTAPEPTFVKPWDLYEPNENVPADIDLDGPDPYPSIAAVRFFNPALAFEDLRDFPFGFDAYRFRTADRTAPLSVVFTAPALGGGHLTWVAGAAGGGWSVGSGRLTCKGAQYDVEQAPSDSVVVALGRLPAGDLDLVAAYAQEGQYLLAVVRAYVSVDPRVGPDRFEEDDVCDFADENHADPARRIELSAPFAEVLTIDNPHDVDWLRFTVPGTGPQPVAIRSRAFPLDAPDRTDIDLHVLAVPTPTRGLDSLGTDRRRGSAGALALTLDPGDYYLVVTDSAGVPTPYGVCLAIGTGCTLPAAPPPPASPSIGAAAAGAAPSRIARTVESARGERALRAMVRATTPSDSARAAMRRGAADAAGRRLP